MNMIEKKEIKTIKKKLDNKIVYFKYFLTQKFNLGAVFIFS